MVQKIVADTNVLISALGWNGNKRKIIRLAIDGRVKLVFSRETFEYLFSSGELKESKNVREHTISEVPTEEPTIRIFSMPL